MQIWHPFTQMLTADPPLKVRRGEGVYLELEDGRRIVDCVSSWWVNIHGHAHPAIANAIHEQAAKLEQVIFAGFTHEPAEELARLLAEKLPEQLSCLFFSDNGSTSVEVALKIAYQYWHNNGEARRKFIAFEGGYHGDTVGAMSIGRGSPFWEKFQSLMFEIETVPFPSTFDNDSLVEEKEASALSAISSLLEQGAGNYAAICIEPLIQGAAGMRVCRAEFLQELRSLADRYNTLLIFDEVMTGFGRTGDWFASSKSKVTPDLICLSKGITGGFLPLSVTICKRHIYDAFLSKEVDKTFFHGHSYTANPVACAAAVCSWHLLKDAASSFEQMESIHRKLYQQELAGNSLFENVRFCGTIFAAEIQTGESNSYFHSLAPELKRRFVQNGYLIRPLGNTVYLMPPYCISESELRGAYKTINKTTAELVNKAERCF